MLDQSLFANTLLPEQDARIFLNLWSLSPYLSPKHLANILTALDVLGPNGEKSWNKEQVAAVCDAYSFSSANQGKKLDSTLQHELAQEASCDEKLISVLFDCLKKIDPNMAIEKEWLYLSFYCDITTAYSATIPDNIYEVASTHFAQAVIEPGFILHEPSQIQGVLCSQCCFDFLYSNIIWASAESIFTFLEEYDPGKEISSESLNFESKDAKSIFYYYGLIRPLQGKDYHCPGIGMVDTRTRTMLEGNNLMILGKYQEAINLFDPVAREWSKKTGVTINCFYPDALGISSYISRFFTERGAQDYLIDLEYIIHNTYFNDEDLGYSALKDLYINKFYSKNIINETGYTLEDLDEVHASLLTRMLVFCACLKATKPMYVQEACAFRDKYAKVAPIVSLIVNDVLKEMDLGVEDLPQLPYGSWLSMVHGIAQWEKQLASLAQCIMGNNQQEDEKQRRLVWMFDPKLFTVQPYTQTLSAKGKWSSGQKMALKRLYDQDVTWITEQDRSMIRAYENFYSYYSFDLRFKPLEGFSRLVGHPYLFNERTREHITLEKRPVEVEIKEENDTCSITLNTRPFLNQDYTLKEVEPNRWVLYVFDRKIHAIDNVLGDKGMELPTEQLPQFLNMVQDLKELEINMQTNTPVLQANSTPVVQLWQQGNAFQAAVRVRPSGSIEGTAFLPGEGSVDVLQVVNGRTASFHRDFDQEIKAAQKLLTTCPTLTSVDQHWDWLGDDIDHFFELITELKELGESCTVEWPEGEKFKLLGTISRSQISIHTQRSGDWFSLSGDVEINELKVLELTELIERSQGKGRFVQLKNGEFLALSDEVKRSLERLRLLTSRKKGKERSVHPLAGPLLEDVMADMRHDSDIEWHKTIKTMQAAFAIKPEVPATLQAELRPYQMSGFVWLCRLSEWGVGGCLADDMGLGKTIQSIAVMLREATKGPCLIVAPTSVCPNWEEEINRFAPTLQVVRLREASTRQSLVDAMRSGMVRIVGYGLLAREKEVLTSKQWQMVVFDEAQALKNNTTKRSRTAAAIPAHFHVALTGTPIENHLEDLWSVFDIINPGLLGTVNDFHRRFCGAEEGGAAAQALKMLIRPFILRRLKSQVLDDLPELTEQTLLIEPTEKEAAFYETLRRMAVERVDEGPQSSGQRRFNILTWLTKLRRACCHATLADPSAGQFVEPISSKLARFLELLEEAKSGGHRLLVFSQFTGHLALVRKVLDERNIFYQYLDGQTPEERRRESVAAFQRGEGDLFLISLKAGGQGLNLTAADYVVHLDPWWNPAVEDQATDRAHRIGQKNPVTVYRLVMAHTVEEKILKLHAQKRDLAADFLEGNDEVAAKTALSEEELLALLS